MKSLEKVVLSLAIPFVVATSAYAKDNSADVAQYNQQVIVNNQKLDQEVKERNDKMVKEYVQEQKAKIGRGGTVDNSTNIKERIKNANISYNAAINYMKSGEIESAKTSITHAFSYYPGNDEPKEWKKTLTKIYMKNIKKMRSENNGRWNPEIDNLLTEIEKNGSTDNWEVCAYLAARLAPDEKLVKKYYDKAIKLDKEKSLVVLSEELTSYWKEKLNLN